MLSVLKELPITIVLQPTGFNTLAQRIYNTYNEVLACDTGLAALTLIAMSAVLTWILVIRRLQPPRVTPTAGGRPDRPVRGSWRDGRSRRW